MIARTMRSVFAKAFLLGVLLSGLCGLSALADKADLDFAAGTGLYNKKKYREALVKFMDVTHANPKHSLAILYTANCCLCIGEKEQAVKYYQLLHTNFPGTPAAAQAGQWLQQAGLLTYHKSASTGAPTGRLAGAPDIAGIVSVVRPRADRPPVSDERVKAIQNALKFMPESVKAILIQNRIRVYVTPTVEDYEPGCKYQEASGYEGGTYKSCPAFYLRGKIVVAQHTLDEDDESVNEAIPEGDMKNALCHEIGHALDDCLDQLSESKEFRHVYWQDQARIDSETAHKLRYYLQQSTAGQAECCAELIGGLLGLHRDHTTMMNDAFPLTLKFLRAKLQM